MTAQNTHLQHPRYGFTEQRLVNETLTSVSLAGTSVSRREGMRFAICAGLITVTAGAGTVRLIIEGSNDNVNWFTIAQTGTTELFTGTGQTRVLNDAGTGLVDLERFFWVRVRTEIVAGTPTFSMLVLCTGIAEDSERFRRTLTFTRAGATPTTQNGTLFPRQAGTGLVNCQVVSSGVVLGGVTQFDAILQGTPDGGTTWFDIGTAIVTGNGAQMMLVDTERLFNLGAFANLRFRVEDNGGAAGAGTAFSINFFLTLDSADWTADANGAGGGSFDPTEVFISAVFGAPGVEAADTIAISFQLFDALGAPLLEVRKVEVIVYDTTQAGDLDLALVATFSAVTTGAAIEGLTTNRVTLTTDATGIGTLDILDAAAETVFLAVVNPQGPNAVPQYVAASTEATLVFA